jgi:IS1 family transposase
MNKLPTEKRAQILHQLCEGMSIRAITRTTGASKNTVAKLLNDVGTACADYHDKHVVGLRCRRVQVDEIWSFVYAKQKNVEDAKAAPDGAGDCWTWTAIDADSKLAVSWLVGPRDATSAMLFMKDVANRIDRRVQVTSDGLGVYIDAVDAAFGGFVDYAQLVKIYGASPESAKGRYSPAECTGARRVKIMGNPDIDHISTSYVERQNLTMRMHMRRFTRLTNGFSKKVMAHANAVALHFMYYNFCRIHSKLRVSPAMAAGVTDRLWEVSDLAALLDERDAAIARQKRGTYKKRISGG